MAVWPVVLATFASLYLWWLAALLFDLIFVWHLYIRHSKMLRLMDDIMGAPKGKVQADTAGSTTPAPA